MLGRRFLSSTVVALALAALTLAPARAATPAPTPAVPGPAARAAGPAPAPAPTAGSATAPGPVVLIGTSGLRWEDVSEQTPALYSLASSGSIAALVVRSVYTTTCPIDGWLAISVGKRAADESFPERQCMPPEMDMNADGHHATVLGWWRMERANTATGYGAQMGLLGDTLKTAGIRTAAVGAGAGIALADHDGNLAQAWPGLSAGPGVGAGDDAGLAEQVRQASASAQLVVVDVGSLRDDSSVSREAQVESLDTRIGLAMGAVPNARTVIVASLGDSSDVNGPHLQFMAATGQAPGGRDYRTGLLTASSTRHDGMAQSTDIMTTLLTLLKVPQPDGTVGSLLTPVSPAGSLEDRLGTVIDYEQSVQGIRPVVPWFYNILILSQIGLYGATTWVLRRDRSTSARARVLRFMRHTAVIFACVPAATFLANLIPWWHSDHPTISLALCVVAFVIPAAGLSLLAPLRRSLLGPMGAVGALTAAVLGLDAATGSQLMTSSLMGYQPVVGGRFYGMGNSMFALFATGMLLAAVSVADFWLRRDQVRLATFSVGLIGVVTVVLDGTPGIGSDFGGPPAILVAFGVLTLLIAGVRLSVRRVAVLVLGTGLIVASISLLDWMRPPTSQTHLGHFVQSVLDGEAGPIIGRKIAQNLAILFTPIATMLPIAAAFVALVLARPAAWGARPLALAYQRAPALKRGMVSFGVLIGIGFALNDSGAVIPAVAATVAIPLLIAVSARALEMDEQDHAEAAAHDLLRGTTGKK